VMIPRVMLHARTLGFLHPTTGRHVGHTSPLPPDMSAVIDALEHIASTARSTDA